MKSLPSSKNSKKLRNDLFACFFMGMMFSSCLVCMHQDWYGSREGYIEYVRNTDGWMDIPWWIWPIPLVVIFVLLVRMNIKYLFTRVEKEEPWDPKRN